MQACYTSPRQVYLVLFTVAGGKLIAASFVTVTSWVPKKMNSEQRCNSKAT